MGDRTEPEQATEITISKSKDLGACANEIILCKR